MVTFNQTKTRKHKEVSPYIISMQEMWLPALMYWIWLILNFGNLESILSSLIWMLHNLFCIKLQHNFAIQQKRSIQFIIWAIWSLFQCKIRCRKLHGGKGICTFLTGADRVTSDTSCMHTHTYMHIRYTTHWYGNICTWADILRLILTTPQKRGDFQLGRMHSSLTVACVHN